MNVSEKCKLPAGAGREVCIGVAAGLVSHPRRANPTMIAYTINAKIFQGLGPKRQESSNGDWV